MVKKKANKTKLTATIENNKKKISIVPVKNDKVIMFETLEVFLASVRSTK